MKIKTVKTKEKLIYEFVDEVIDHGFKANQEVVNLVNNKQLSKLGWLFERASKLVSDLRKADRGWIGEIEEK
uniref:hypothetical protein n=1 Tax=Lactobacillus acidophilus TaxID=1579 RepID=UPI003F543E2B